MIMFSRAFTIFRNEVCVELRINFIFLQLATVEYFRFEDLKMV